MQPTSQPRFQGVQIRIGRFDTDIRRAINQADTIRIVTDDSLAEDEVRLVAEDYGIRDSGETFARLDSARELTQLAAGAKKNLSENDRRFLAMQLKQKLMVFYAALANQMPSRVQTRFLNAIQQGEVTLGNKSVMVEKRN